MFYCVAQQLGIDEAIKKFKGRCSFKQYIKSKPVRWGIKVFCVCCSLTGYLWNGTIYVGKNESDEDQQQELSATHVLVRNLLRPLSGKNHIAHMDNWFSSIPLFNDLATMKIWCCGTVRVNRKGLCNKVTMKKSEESKLKKNPGTIRWASYGPLCYIAWFAKRPVHLLTNCYSPVSRSDNDSSSVMHWFSENGEKVHKEIPRPPAVHSYNLYMGAVDMFDQYRSYVNVEIRSRKFWHPIFWFMVESALINSWLLYKATRVLSLLPLQYNLFTFRKSIALALAAHWEKMGCRNKTFTTPTPTKSMMHSNSQIRVHLRKLNFDDEIRFTGTDLHVSQFEPIPLKQGSKLEVRQMRCQLCKKRRTSFWCRQCKKPLCKGVCFSNYHTKPASPVAKKG